MAQSNQANANTQYQPPEISVLPPNEDQFSLPQARRPYRRQKSWGLAHGQYQHVSSEDQDTAEGEDDQKYTESQGLELSDVPQNASSSMVRRIPSDSKATSVSSVSLELRTSEEPFSQTTTPQNTHNARSDAGIWLYEQASRYSVNEPTYRHIPSNVGLLPHEPNGHSVDGCPTQGELVKSWSWFTTIILILTVYSTLFSAIFLGIALAKPRWGRRIGTRGALSYDSATLLSALFSKSVELAFATTFVVTLGQILSRRAFAKKTLTKGKSGISIAEMNMRLWIMQPGTLITHWVGAKYVITTVLGVGALIAAVAAAFYTTACESLVSPKLKFGINETLSMFGQVSTSYANAAWLAQNCETPISTEVDPDSGLTCLSVAYAGNGYRNFDSWMVAWRDRQAQPDNVDTSKSLPRPPPVAILFENTTVNGQWLTPSHENITKDSNDHGRLVQNVTLVMPHSNVFHAARHPKNRLLQPDDLQGAGEYYLKAAVPAPGLNVLCVGASEHELAPLMMVNKTEPPNPLPNTTIFDDFFGWTSTPNLDVDPTKWYAPWFPKLPNEFNTLINKSTIYGPESVYLLAAPPNTIITSDYVLCGIKSFQYTDCSTSYHVAQSGGQLLVHCSSDPELWKPYRKTVKDEKDAPPLSIMARDWKDVGYQWISGIALGAGITDGNAAVARLVTQMIPPWSADTNTVLNPIQPTIGEALGVLAAYTLMLSSDAAPFVHDWDYDVNPLLTPALANFTAIVSYKDYASGGDQKWKGIFYIILVAVFLESVFCLVYLSWHYIRYGEVTDYTEPQNLFALAINSPPSQLLAGTCGGGPSGEVLGRRWCVDIKIPSSNLSTPNINSSGHIPGHDYDTSHNNRYSTGPVQPHFFVRYPEEQEQQPLLEASSSLTQAPEPESFRISNLLPAKHVNWSPILHMKRSRKVPKRARSVQDFDVGESPTVKQFNRLTGR